MMKSKAIIPLVLGLAVGFATVKLAINTIRKARAGTRSTNVVLVVRARQDIAPYKKILPEMVEVLETPENALIPDGDRFEKIEDVVGRISAKPIPQNAAVLQSMVAPEGTVQGMVGRIPPGFRAVSVRIDEVTGVAFQISPGDWVDVIVVMDVGNLAAGGRDTIAEVILQHVQVAAIGYATAPGVSGGLGKVKPAKSATLLVRDQDVPKLHLAATRGKITLAMRGYDERTTDNLPFANLGDIISGLRSGGEKGSSREKPTNRPTPPQWQRPATGAPHEVVVYHGVGGDRGPSAIERITFATGSSSKIVNVQLGYPARGTSVLNRPSPRPTGMDDPFADELPHEDDE